MNFCRSGFKFAGSPLGGQGGFVEPGFLREALAATGRNITYSICPFIAGAAPAEGGAVIPTLALAVVGGHF